MALSDLNQVQKGKLSQDVMSADELPSAWTWRQPLTGVVDNGNTAGPTWVVPSTSDGSNTGSAPWATPGTYTIPERQRAVQPISKDFDSWPPQRRTIPPLDPPVEPDERMKEILRQVIEKQLEELKEMRQPGKALQPVAPDSLPAPAPLRTTRKIEVE